MRGRQECGGAPPCNPTVPGGSFDKEKQPDAAVSGGSMDKKLNDLIPPCFVVYSQSMD